MMNIHLVSDFNLDILKRFLEMAAREVAGLDNAQVHSSPLNQGMPYLLSLIRKATAEDAVILVFFPEHLFSEFQRAKRLEEYDEPKVFTQLDEYILQIRELAAASRLVITLPFKNTFNEPGYGLLDWRPGLGIRHLLAKMNLHFAAGLSDCPNVFLFDSDELNHHDPAKFSSKLWYAARSPFSNQAYKTFANELVLAIRAFSGKSRRLIILDLDQTLWGGLVGETGPEGVRLGGHDHVGEAFKDFQRALKMMTNRGVQLAIVSKNDESVALDAIDHHPEMILRRQDFAGWRINWNDKAGNVLDLLNDLNVGAASAVFIDDNPAERERVRMAVPEVQVPEWPGDPTQYVRSLWALGCFDTAVITEEDRARTAMYEEERSRKESKARVDGLDRWLESLATKVIVEPLNAANLPRVAQLYNKTNQLNLSSRRLSPAEVLKWAQESNRKVLSISLSDRFGDMGLTGVLGLEHQGDTVRLVDYILSCRVMGRKIEETLFHLAVTWARARQAKRLLAVYVPTARNRPTLEVFEKANLKKGSENEFIWWCDEPYAKPQSIDLRVAPGLLPEA